MRTWIQGGTVYDGSGSEPFQADLLVEDKIITQVGRVDGQDADEVIDARGMAVTPGFIDSHRHGDFALFTDPDYGTAELAQGITTVINGNCGMSAAPMAPPFQQEWYAFIEPCLGRPPRDADFRSFARYFEAASACRLPLSVGSLVGTGTVKAGVRGMGGGAYSAREMQLARQALCEALDAGAMGISCGIMYVPECWSASGEYAELLKPAARWGRPLCCHMRGEGDTLVQAVEEAIDIAARAELPLNISHFKVFGRQNWGRTLPLAIDRIEQARAKGQPVTVDFYPYTGGSTTLLTLVPPCCLRETTQATLEYLASPEGTDRLRREILREQPGWDNMVQSIGWERVIVSSVTGEKNQRAQGMSIPEICRLFGDTDETACMVRLLCEEQGKVGVIVMSMDPADVELVAGLPYSTVISDALYGAPDFPHPRLYGAFPRVLRHLVRERKILSLEAAVHKMSGQTAALFGLKDRGLLRPGLRADINLFDPATVEDAATFSAPKQLARGMHRVLVGGKTAFPQGQRVPQAQGGLLKLSKPGEPGILK